LERFRAFRALPAECLDKNSARPFIPRTLAGVDRRKQCAREKHMLLSSATIQFSTKQSFF
jgi:hypothetical protein